MTLRNSQKTEPAAIETFSVSAGRNSRHDGAATMRHDGQPGTQRVDGSASLLHAAAGLVASDRRAGVGSTCPVQRQGAATKAGRLCAAAAATTAPAAGRGSVGRTLTAAAR